MRSNANAYFTEFRATQVSESADQLDEEGHRRQVPRVKLWNGPKASFRAFSEPPILIEEPSERQNDAMQEIMSEMKRTKERISIYKRTTAYLLELCGAILKAEKPTSSLKTTDDLNEKKPAEIIHDVASFLDDLAHQRPQESLVRWHETKMKAKELYKCCSHVKTGAQRRGPFLADHSQSQHRFDLIMTEDVSELAEMAISGILWPDSQHKILLNMHGPKAQSLANLLYEVLPSKKEKRSRRQIERSLRKVCGHAGILPSAFYLKRDQLRRVSVSAVACGGFADIYEGTFEEKKVAMKVLRIYSGERATKARENFYKEVVYWKDLAHPNIVPFLGLADPDVLPLCMVSEWMPHGNLLSYLKTYPRANRMNLISDIIAGLYHLHRLGIVHGDMKSGNVLIDVDYRARLADFGLAQVTPEPSTMSLMQTSSAVYGSLRWMAPELLIPPHDILSTPKLCAETDTYATGMVILETFTGKIPFHDQSHDAFVVINVSRGIRPARPYDASSKGLTDNVWSLITDCWHADARVRPRMEEIRTRFESERTKFEPPEVTSPEECEEVESLISVADGNGHEEYDDTDFFDSDIDGSFIRQDLTRTPADVYDKFSTSTVTAMRFNPRRVYSDSSGSARARSFSSSNTFLSRGRGRGGSYGIRAQDEVDELASMFEARLGAE